MIKNIRRILIVIFSLLMTGLSASMAVAQVSVQDIVMAVFQSDNSLQVAINQIGSASIEIYDGTGGLLSTLEPNFETGGILALDWNAGGNRLAAIYVTGAIHPNTVVWNVVTSTIVAEHQIDFARFVYWHPVNPDALMIVLGNTIAIWDVSSSMGLATYDPSWNSIEYAEWSPSGEHIALIGGTGNVRVLNTQTWLITFEVFMTQSISERTSYYFSLAFSPDEDRIALYDLMNTEVEIWNVLTNQAEFMFDSFDTSMQHYEILRWVDRGIVGIDLRIGQVVLYDPSDGTFEHIVEGVTYSGAYIPPSGDTILFMPPQIQPNSPFFVEVEIPGAVEPTPTFTPTLTPTFTPTPTPTPTPPPAGGPNQILFASSSTGVTELDIYRINPDGTGLTRLTNIAGNDAFPAWSPDGTQIAFASTRDGNYEIYVMNADGSNPVRLTNHSAADEFPVWSPDGSQIAFSSQRDGNWELYVMNTDGSNPIRLTNHSAEDLYASWSPDGTKIAFSSLRDGNYEIYVINADGTNLTRLTNNSARDEVPNWSPDGSQIAFTSNRDGNLEIYAMNADGTNVRRLTSHAAVDEFPNWSAGGSEIVFSSSRSSFFNLFLDIHVMNADGTNVRRLTSAFSFDRFPAWGYP